MQPMANDRLMVRCAKCRETYTLAKYWGGGEFQQAAALSVEGQRQAAEPLDVWLTRHGRECLGHFGNDLGGLGDGLVLVAERTP